MTTTTRFQSRANQENAPAIPAGKNVTSFAHQQQSKRALGDITNFAHHNSNNNNNNNNNAKQAGKVRRTTTTKPTSTNSGLARRAKSRALADAAKKSASPMVTSTQSRRASARLARRAAATVAAMDVSCKLDFDLELMPYDAVHIPVGVKDIDGSDYGDEMMNACYAKHAYERFCDLETKFMVHADYMTRQEDITVKMRAILVDWLVDVHLKFKLQPETLHLTVNIIDRFLEKKEVLRRRLQLVGVTAMFIASKYEEIYAPEVADFVYISDKAYSKDEILAMEALILNHLKFEVTVPSSLTFLSRCLKAARVDSGCDNENHHHLAQYLCELSLQDSSMLLFRPSVRAASAVSLAAKLFFLPLQWTPTMQFYSGGWSEQELAQCEFEMRRMLEHERDVNNTNKLTAVKRKFGLSRFGCVSTCVPYEVNQPMGMDICQAE